MAAANKWKGLIAAPALFVLTCAATAQDQSKQIPLETIAAGTNCSHLSRQPMEAH
jgi:hypothetical protein